MFEQILNFNPYLVIVFLTLLPFLELRASIPYGLLVLGKTNWLPVILLAIIVNIILAPIVYFFLDKFLHLFLRIKFINKIWNKIFTKNQKKLKPYIDKYGVLGLSVFIGIPLPGSGVYSGAIGAYLLGFSYKDFIKSAIYGVLIAAILVSIVMLTGINTFDIFIKKI